MSVSRWMEGSSFPNNERADHRQVCIMIVALKATTASSGTVACP